MKLHRSRTLGGVALVALSVAGLASDACSAKVISPSPTVAASTNTAANLATGLTIRGSMTLSTKGETEPLAAMVTFADGSVEDRTAVSSWSSTNQAVATISPAGVVTAMADGRTTINATFGNLSASKTIVVDLP